MILLSILFRVKVSIVYILIIKMSMKDFLITSDDKMIFGNIGIDEIRELKKGLYTYNKLINKLYKDEIIDNSDLVYMSELATKRSKTNLHRFMSIASKVKSNQSHPTAYKSFKRICNEMFPRDISLMIDFDDMDKSNVRLISEDMFTLMDFTNDQKLAIEKVMKFLFLDTSYAFGLYGYAGTGKTTLLSEIMYYLLDNRLVRSIAFTAPTNKAVSVLKGKFRGNLKKLSQKSGKFNDDIEKMDKKGTKIHFMTAQKLLGYKNDFDSEGDRIFIRGGSSQINRYDIVVVDEVSMISRSMIKHIIDDLESTRERNGSIPKVLFVGDPAQLPPVNEDISMMFKQKIEGDKYSIAINKMESIVLKDVIRSNKKNLVDLCNDVRSWVIGDSDTIDIIGNIGDGVKMFRKKEEKTKTMWARRFMKHINDDNGDIILVWTNKQADEYNKMARSYVFDNKDVGEYESNDVLIMEDFYNIVDEKEKVSFYTSEQIRVMEVEKTTYTIPLLHKKKILDEMKKEKKSIQGVVSKTIDRINDYTRNKKYHTWDLYAKKLNEDAMVRIKVISKKSKKKHEADRDMCKDMIKQLRDSLIGIYRTKKNIIENAIISVLWKEWYGIFTEPFACVNYGYAISTHKSQGSTYYNVYVDLHNILQNPLIDEGKRCAYTAVTRASNEVCIMV